MRYGLMILVLGVSLIWADTIMAQGSDREMLESAVDRTGQVIERAREIVGRSNSERAKSLLEAAIRLQAHAEELISVSSPVYGDAQAISAGKYTRSAREKALRAIAIARQMAENEDYIRRRLERSDELIRRATDKAGPEPPENVRLVLASARDKHQRAVELFRNRRYKMSLQLSLQVEKSMEGMLDEAGGYAKARQRFESLQERYYTLLDRIQVSGLDASQQNLAELDQVEQFRLEAEQLASDNAFIRAELAMQNAVEVLLRVSEELKEPTKTKSALDRLTQQAEIIGAEVGTRGDDQTKKSYRAALDHLEKALTFYRAGNYDAAATQLQAARQILNQIRKLLDNKG